MHVYYISLAELIGALVFLVVFKVVMLYAMETFGNSVSEEREKAAVKPAAKPLPLSYRLTKHVLASYLLVSGLIQIDPAMLSVSLSDASAHLFGASGVHGSGPASWFLQLWRANKMWLNIWSVVVQLTFAVTLWSFRHVVSVRITAAIVALSSLFLWVVTENFGYIAWPSATILAGAPGASLLVTVVSASLVLPLQVWTTASWLRFLLYGNAAYWFFAAWLQSWPGHGFWTGIGYSRLIFAQLAPWNHWLHALFLWVIHMSESYPMVSTAVWGVLDLAIALSFIISFYDNRWLFPTVLVSVVVLGVVWITYASIGLQGNFVFGMGIWPLMAWGAICTLFVRRR